MLSGLVVAAVLLLDSRGTILLWLSKGYSPICQLLGMLPLY